MSRLWGRSDSAALNHKGRLGGPRLSGGGARDVPGRLRSPEWIDLAAKAHEDGLTVFDRVAFEREWASLESDLGDALAEGVRLDRPDLRPAAERAYRSALEVFGQPARGREVQAKLERL